MSTKDAVIETKGEDVVIETKGEEEIKIKGGEHEIDVKKENEMKIVLRNNNNVIENINSQYGYPTPNEQILTGDIIMNNLFFSTKYEFMQIQRSRSYDYVIVGTGPCSYAFMEQILRNNENAKILCLERGSYFLPEHFQNLPLAFSTTVGINGLTETYPWTLSSKTANNKNYIKFQRGQVPVLGGRSILWSGWCPRPTKELLEEWPEQIQSLLLNNEDRFKRAEHLLNVVSSDKINNKEGLNVTKNSTFLYGQLQEKIYKILEKNLKNTKNSLFYRLMYAPLAVGQQESSGVSFAKFSTVGPILELVTNKKSCLNIDIVTNTIVEKIINQKNDDDNEYIVTGLKTNRGIINIRDAKLILGMGMYPAVTLVTNSFPELNNIGKRISCHFISSITARIKRDLFQTRFKELENNAEIGAVYIEGIDKQIKNNPQFHIQLSIISDPNPNKHKYTLFKYAPDVVAAATEQQLKDSKDYVIFVCAVLGELDHKNKNNFFIQHKNDDNINNDITKNMYLQIIENENDLKLWNSMDNFTFDMLENMLVEDGANNIEYWHSSKEKWINKQRPSSNDIRVPGVVHESSSMHIGNDKDDKSCVDLNYKLKGVDNTYIMGASLWPRGGSWNPTLTMCALAQDLADKLTIK